jgi:hypothetical protein
VVNTDKARCYLNNILEQDRAIKKRICAKQHFRRFDCARRTIQVTRRSTRFGKGKCDG